MAEVHRIDIANAQRQLRAYAQGGYCDSLPIATIVMWLRLCVETERLDKTFEELLRCFHLSDSREPLSPLQKATMLLECLELVLENERPGQGLELEVAITFLEEWQNRLDRISA
jgi:hypothetical protein